VGRVNASIGEDGKGVGRHVADVGGNVLVRPTALVRPGVNVVLGLPRPEVPANRSLARTVGSEGSRFRFEQLPEPGPLHAVLFGVSR